jgi:AraC-like DNA-binding protein
MLVGESVALKEIAARLGYADTSAFTKAFRRHTGESPGSFRRRWRGMTENLLA